MSELDNEGPDEKIDGQIIKLAEQYASCDRRSAEINDERSTIRDNAEKLGIPSKAFQHAVGMVKHMSEGERRDYTIGVNRVVRAISGRQAELFPAEAERVRKREDAKAAEGKSKAELDAKTDSDPRSDPASGGAGPLVDLMTEEQNAAEQAEGEAALSQAAAPVPPPVDVTTLPNPSVPGKPPRQQPKGFRARPAATH